MKGDKNVYVEDGESVDVRLGVSVDLEGGKHVYATGGEKKDVKGDKNIQYM